VEPGCYFIDALLTKTRDDPISSKFFNWQEVEKYKSFGGVRIESDVVCPGYYDNYVVIPLYVFLQQHKPNIVYLGHLEYRKRKTDIMCVHILVSLFQQTTLHWFCAMARITVKSKGTSIS